MFNFFRKLFGFGKTVRSRIIIGEAVSNSNPRFGSARRYYPVVIQSTVGEQRALFTQDQISVAIERSVANPEDWK